MEWTILGLFGVSVLFFIISIVKTNNTSKAEEERIDMVHISVMKEMKEVKESIHQLELDNEVIMKEAGVSLSPDDKILKREILNFYKRGYSFESIAQMKGLSVNKVEELLAPFMTEKNERGKVANEN